MNMVHAAHLFIGYRDKLSQNIEIDVFEFGNVEAGLTDFVFTKFFEERAEFLEAGHDVDGQVRFARRETRQDPIAFLTCWVFVVIAPEANHTVAPHHRFFAGDFFHHY